MQKNQRRTNIANSELQNVDGGLSTGYLHIQKVLREHIQTGFEGNPELGEKIHADKDATNAIGEIVDTPPEVVQLTTNNNQLDPLVVNNNQG